jgi:hypothetical protein
MSAICLWPLIVISATAKPFSASNAALWAFSFSPANSFAKPTPALALLSLSSCIFFLFFSSNASAANLSWSNFKSLLVWFCAIWYSVLANSVFFCVESFPLASKTLISSSNLSFFNCNKAVLYCPSLIIPSLRCSANNNSCDSINWPNNDNWALVTLKFSSLAFVLSLVSFVFLTTPDVNLFWVFPSDLVNSSKSIPERSNSSCISFNLSWLIPVLNELKA